MLQFVNFSSYDYQIYLVVDEDAHYRWNVENESIPVKYWLKHRDEFKFKLEFEGDITSIAVYRGEQCIHCEEIAEVNWL